jgi:hypothetical protein
MLKLIANIESFGPAGYIASIDSIKGLVVQADSPQSAAKKLLLSLKAKIAFDYKLEIEDVEHQEFESEEEMFKYISGAKEGKNELKLNFC